MKALGNRRRPSPLGADARQLSGRPSAHSAQTGLGEAQATALGALHCANYGLDGRLLAPKDEIVTAREPFNSPGAAVTPISDDRQEASRRMSPSLVDLVYRLVELGVLLSLTATVSNLHRVTGGDTPGADVPIALALGVLLYGGVRLMATGGLPETFSPLGSLASKLPIWLCVSSTTALTVWALQAGLSIPAIYLATWVLLGTLVVCGAHGASAWAWRRLATAGRLVRRRMAIVGASSQAAHLITRLHEPDAAPLFDIVGVYDDRIGGDRLPPGRFAGERLGGKVCDLLERDRSAPPDIIVFALPHNAVARLNRIVDTLGSIPAHFRLCPDLVNSDAGLAYVAGAEDLTDFLRRIYSEGLSKKRYVAKSLQDRVLAALLLLLLGPLLLLIAFLIKIDSPGPVLFKQKRFGLWNRPIEVLKFRTMFHHRCDPTGSTQTVRDDARVTRFGRFLRRSSMDELPQLINVLRGDMSLVGPRPHPILMKVLDRDYGEIVPLYAVRHRMKPGITGLSQINGLRGEVDTLDKAIKVLEMDLQYIRDWSFFLDLSIIVKTVFVFARDPKAY